MSFKDWLFSNREYNVEVNGQWGLKHILVLVLCIATIIALAIIFRRRSEKTRKIVITTLISLIFILEIARRIINLVKTTDYTLNGVLYDLLPRPWCAISCWILILSLLVRKKYFYNFGSMSALICALIFFAYPEAGFNHQYIQFENLYSIGTHALLLITSITLITLKFTDFNYKTIWKEGIMLAIVFAYAFFEIYVLKIATDPLYFMPNNDVQDVLGMTYSVYLPIYIAFMGLFFNSFYLIQKLANKLKHKRVSTS